VQYRPTIVKKGWSYQAIHDALQDNGIACIQLAVGAAAWRYVAG
jgi:hypothetical protein